MLERQEYDGSNYNNRLSCRVLHYSCSSATTCESVENQVNQRYLHRYVYPLLWRCTTMVHLRRFPQQFPDYPSKLVSFRSGNRNFGFQVKVQVVFNQEISGRRSSLKGFGLS